MQFPPQRKALLKQLADGSFHSGTSLAAGLGLSRTAVWQIIHDLENLGLEIDAVSGKGYRLRRPLDLFDAGTLRGELSELANTQLNTLEIHDQLDSTNTYLMQQAGLGQASGSACLAEFQTAGRGRIGRSWFSPFAGNICLSLLWRFDSHAAIAGLSLAVGVALVRALRKLGIEGVGLKWPNDLLWQDRKLGGILLEVSGEAHGSCAVVIGIGLNVRMARATAQAIDQAWVDLDQISHGKPPSRNRLCATLLQELLELLADYPARGLPAYIREWRQQHCYAGRRVVLQVGGRAVAGTVAGVSDAGLLLLDGEDGQRREFASGDLGPRPHG
jgi:BirA family biotin operon repressor/biotin-[acetyl-CoA-carboxylase] ligase